MERVSERIKFVLHHGVRLLLIDFSDCAAAEVVELIKQAKKVIRSEPEQSVLLATVITNTHFSREVTNAVRAYVDNNRPYVRASAVVGVTGLQGIIINALKAEAGREIAVFDDLEKAKDWLLNISKKNLQVFLNRSGNKSE
jgi:hypothetical protein